MISSFFWYNEWNILSLKNNIIVKQKRGQKLKMKIFYLRYLETRILYHKKAQSWQWAVIYYTYVFPHLCQYSKQLLKVSCKYINTEGEREGKGISRILSLLILFVTPIWIVCVTEKHVSIFFTRLWSVTNQQKCHFCLPFGFVFIRIRMCSWESWNSRILRIKKQSDNIINTYTSHHAWKSYQKQANYNTFLRNLIKRVIILMLKYTVI